MTAEFSQSAQMKTRISSRVGRLIDEWSGESIRLQDDAVSGATIIIATHSSRLGPVTGGTRLLCYPDIAAAVTDAMRLAEGMTYKWAVLRVARGGGKAVIDLPEDLQGPAREQAAPSR